MKIEELKKGQKILVECEFDSFAGANQAWVLIQGKPELAQLDNIKLNQPKPVVPQFVVEWLKKYRYAHTLLKFLNAAEKEQIVTSAVNGWILDNQYDFIKAWIDGYEEETDETE